jgi:hypothetical protein
MYSQPEVCLASARAPSVVLYLDGVVFDAEGDSTPRWLRVIYGVQ